MFERKLSTVVQFTAKPTDYKEPGYWYPEIGPVEHEWKAHVTTFYGYPRWLTILSFSSKPFRWTREQSYFSPSDIGVFWCDNNGNRASREQQDWLYEELSLHLRQRARSRRGIALDFTVEEISPVTF